MLAQAGGRTRSRLHVVLTAVDGERRLTDTTSAIHRSDLEQPSLPFDSGRHFLFARLIRGVFQAVETDRAVERGDPFGDEHAVRGDPDIFDELFAQFRERGFKTEHYLDGVSIDE
ncbi:hypothetical protein BRC79_08310 [Halobacteriales archaeon QH_8_67_27]|nr:MAG: hypothetical protein BRC79_08310 [Halobacteriales archaeon QH_8_67_27]